MWRSIVGAILGVLVVLGMAQAQVQGCSSGGTWNYDRMAIVWEYEQVVEPPPTGIRLKIGSANNAGVCQAMTPAQFTISRDLPANQFEIMGQVALPGPGGYCAVVMPTHMVGTTIQEGAPSDPCFFASGRARLKIGIKLK